MKQSTRRILTFGVATMAGAALIGPGRHWLAGRIRSAQNPSVDDLLTMPGDVVRHDVDTHDGGSVHVVQVGSGRPLVLLHGVTLAAEVWAPIMHLVRDRFTVYALDVRGHGASVVGSDGVGRRPAAHDLASVLEALDLRDAIVCGHSMGGMILGQFCGDFPTVLNQRVAGLAFMDTAAYGLLPPGVDSAARRFGAFLVQRAEAGRPFVPPSSIDDETLVMRMAFGAHPSGAAVDVARRLGHDLSEEYRTQLWVDLFDTDNRSGLAGATQPAVVMVGSRDLLTPVYAAKRLERVLPNAELEIVPGAGHQLMQERPARVARIFDDLAKRIATGDDVES